MQVFRLLGDLAHLSSILILIHRIHIRKTCAGISLQTRILYLCVFLSRYGDLFLYYVSFYNTFMKLLYLATSSYLVFLMVASPAYKDTWYRALDNFNIAPLLVLAGILAVLVPYRYTLFEVLWAFSIVLESIAILPQLYHLTQVPSLPALPLSHLLALGLYRFFYVLHWMTKAVTHTSRKFDFVPFFFGVLQTLIWADFLWVWYNRKIIKLVDDQPGDAEAAIGSGGPPAASSVDQGDLSRSFVLFHIFTMAKAFEERFVAARRGRGVAGAGGGLSVSAYPDEEVRIQREGVHAATFSDTPAAAPAPAEETTTMPIASAFTAKQGHAGEVDADGFSVASEEEDDQERRAWATEDVVAPTSESVPGNQTEPVGVSGASTHA